MGDESDGGVNMVPMLLLHDHEIVGANVSNMGQTTFTSLNSEAVADGTKIGR